MRCQGGGGISDIGDISDTSNNIHIPGLVNVDFEDVKTVMSEPGKAMMGTAVAGGPDRANKAADLAVACPLLEGIDLSGARGVLVLIAASKATIKLSESPCLAMTAMTTIRRFAADDAHVIYGTVYDETLGDWHGRKEIDARTWLSGIPSPTASRTTIATAL